MSMKSRILSHLFRVGLHRGPWFDKFIILANVLLHDWRLYPAYGGNRRIADLTRAEIESVYAGIDEQSRSHILRFYECCLLPNFTNETAQLCFHNVQKILTAEERRAQGPIRGYLRKQNRHYQVYMDVESSYFHHGLRDIPNAKGYLNGKCVIDAGACKGDSALIFIDHYHPAKVYSFEPSPRNCVEYKTNLERNHFTENQFVLCQKGLGAERGIIHFQDTGDGANNLQTTGECEAEVLPLDEFCKGIPERVGVVKADVEGMGLDLIRGAEQTIRADRPILLLSIYHNPEEFLGIYQLLKSWDLDYRITARLMRLPMQVDELDLIACPNEIRSNPGDSGTTSF